MADNTEQDEQRIALVTRPPLLITGKSKAYPIWLRLPVIGRKRLRTKELKTVQVKYG